MSKLAPTITQTGGIFCSLAALDADFKRSRTCLILGDLALRRNRCIFLPRAAQAYVMLQLDVAHVQVQFKVFCTDSIDTVELFRGFLQRRRLRD